MMKKLGCLMAVAGVLIFVGAFALFGRSIWQAIEAREVHRVEIKAEAPPAEKPGEKAGEKPGEKPAPKPAPKPVSTEVLTVSTEKACQLEVELEIKVKSAKKVPTSPGETGYQAKYKFPFSYKVTGEKGAKIFAEKEALAWDAGMRSYGDKKLDETGGTLTVTHHLEKFDVPAPGRVKVEAEIKPDAEFGAELVKAELVVYDNVTRHAKSVGIGMLMLFGGPVLFVLGGLVFVVGLVFGGGGRGRHR